MKELYLEAELKIVKFSMVDIITTSTEYTYPTGEDDVPPVSGEIPGW